MLNLKRERAARSEREAPCAEAGRELVTHLFERDLGAAEGGRGVHRDHSFLEVPMQDCLRLLEKYELEMRRGKGRARVDAAASVLQTIFERSFRKENQKIRKNLASLTRGNPELRMIVDSLKEFRQWKLEGERPAVQRGPGFQISIRDIDFFAQSHFPLCMYEMFRTLKREKHLKHNGRLQLILFMKGLGLKAEEMVAFFRAVVGKGPAAKKVKEYEYMVKHSFGLVGSKTAYSGYGCPKIMSNSRPSKGDVHGCPFNYYGEDSLFKLLVHKLGNEKQAQEVLRANSMGAKFGCRKFFCTKNKLLDIEDVDDGVGRHPNIYFNVSYFRKGKKREFRRPGAPPAKAPATAPRGSSKIQVEAQGA